MFTKFHSNTIETKFIQNLINSTNIPLSNVWHTKKFVVVGNSYLTDKGIYKALKTGLWESLTDKYENEPCFEWVGNYVFG